MADLKQRPSTRERPRSRSAKARLTPPGPETVAMLADRDAVVKEARERAKSAKVIRGKHTASSKVFPARPSSRANKDRFTSMYSSDFDGSFTAPPELRPTSPTRRNNPHPAKQFMVWRLPSREIGGLPYEEGLELPPEYITRNPEFDAVDELSHSLDSLKLPPPRPTSSDYGAYLHRQKQRQLKRETGGAGASNYQSRLKPVGTDIFNRTVASENQEALSDWLKYASPEEQHTVLKMLKSAEATQVNDTINQVMKPGAAQAVHSWLQDADDKERDVAVRLFSSLGSRPPAGGMRQRSYSESDSRPPSRKPFPPPDHISTGAPLPPTGRGKPKYPAGVWHHKPIRDPPPQVYHRGALFGGIRGGATHYTIHPEWPDYYGPPPHNTSNAHVH